jgi:hypothetical protein
MKYAVLTALLSILGALLIFHTVNTQQLLNWAQWEPVLQERKVETQDQAVKLAVDYYRRGLLPEYLNQRAVLAFMVGLGMLLTGLFATLHIAADKLFWKKFYEQPNIVLALKRGAIFAAVPVILFYLGVWNLLDWMMLGLVIVAAIFLELISNSILGGTAKRAIIQQKPVTNEQKQNHSQKSEPATK